MKDVIYLLANRSGVQAMRKSFTGAKKDEVCIKLHVEVDDKAFSPPTIEKWVVVNDWKEGIDVDDVKFEKQFITEDEAEMIRQKRLQKMRQILESQGYTVQEPVTDEVEEV